MGKKATSKVVVHEEVKTKAKKKAKKQAPRVRAAGDKNLYLLCLLNPTTGPVVGIPDLVTMKSVKLRTIARAALTTGANCTWFVGAFAPTVAGNFFTAGGNTTGTTVHSIAAASAGAAALASSTPATVSSATVGPSDLAMMAATFAAIRPVAMEVRIVCTQALSAATGVHGMSLIPAQALPVQLENSAVAGCVSNGLAASGAMTGSVGGFTFSPPVAPTSINGALGALDDQANITQCVSGLWCPQDTTDLAYVPLGGAAEVAEATQFNTVNWTNSNLTEVDTYVVPYQLASVAANANLGAQTIAFRANNYPMLYYVASGLTTGTFAEAQITTVWEAIPLPFAGPVLGATVSPSNPDEEAQADNVMEIIPTMAKPDVDGDLGMKMREAGMMAAGHLYQPDVPKRAAVTGRSMLKAGGAVAGALAPILGALPVVGGLLGPGAALASAMAGAM